jgi:hypothetical protein
VTCIQHAGSPNQRAVQQGNNAVHPVTGEVFAADSPYQHPDTLRALFEAVSAPGSDTTKQAHGKPAGTFVRWSA